MYWWYSKIAIHQFYVNINERTIQLWRADIADSLKEISFSSRTEHSAIYDYSVNTLEERAGHGAAAPGPPGLLPVQVVCTRGLGEALPGHEVHHGGLAGGEAERGERHVAVEEPALVDQPEDLRFRHRFFLPLWRPVIKDKLSDVPRTLTRTEQILLGLPAHEDEA